MSFSIYPYIFGNDAPFGAYNTVLNANSKVVGKYNLAVADDIYFIVFLGITVDEPTAKIKGVIYSDNAGEPDALIAVTDEVVGVYANQLLALPFSTPVNLSSGDYWLGFICDTYLKMQASSVTSGFNKYNADTYSDGPTDPFGSYSSSNYHRIFYASDDAIPMMGISTANGYSVLKSLGGISQAVAYAVLDEKIQRNQATSIIIT